MNEFNKVAQAVLKEADVNIDPKIGSHYKQISDLLSKKGIKAFEQNDILDVVQHAIKLAFNEGYKAAESNPFR
jgi:succinyl-CoA synthetase beta subunit